MEIIFLGTAAGKPSPTRGASGTILRCEKDVWLVDCGEGTQIQLMRSKVKPGRINKIFITHLHGDHVFGLPGLLCTLSMSSAYASDPDKQGTAPVEIYGPQGLRRMVRTNLRLSASELTFDYVVHELHIPEADCPENWQMQASCECNDSMLHPNEQQGRDISASPEDHTFNLFESSQFVIYAAPLTHRVPCCGYVFKEKPQPGRLDAELLKSRGVPPGPLYARIKAGKDITAPDGSTIKPCQVLGLPRQGRKIVILGDTCESSRMVPIAMAADVLVHEATLTEELRELCVSRGHSTPVMAAEFAARIRCQHLVLFHFSQRYYPLSRQVEEGEESVQKLLDEGRAAFPGGRVTAAEDFDVIPVNAKR